MRLLFVLFVLITLIQPVSATQIVSSGGYTFHVDVRNHQFRPIYKARVQVFVSSRRATLKIRSDGYRDARKTVYLRESQKSYNVDVRLADPTVFHQVQNTAGETVRARVDQGQFMSSGADWYRLEIQIDEPGYTRFTRHDVGVRVNSIQSFMERVRVRGHGEHRRIVVELRRADLQSFQNRIRVQFPADEALLASRRESLRTLNFRLLKKANASKALLQRHAAIKNLLKEASE